MEAVVSYTLGRFTSAERDPGTHCTGVWMGLEQSRHNGEQKNLLPHPKSDLDFSVVQVIITAAISSSVGS
jgi:hypothetical protein